MDCRGRALNVFRAGAVIALLVFVPLVQAQTPPSWTQLVPGVTAPQGRYAHSAVYDPGSNRLIVFGGQSIGVFLNDVWVLANANGQGGTPSWTLLAAIGAPAVRAYHSAVYDPASNRMIVFGGQTTYGNLTTNVVWVLSNANGLEPVMPAWTQLIASGSPSSRLGHSAVYDQKSNRMIIFGGQIDTIQATMTNDVWVLSNANGLEATPAAWTRLAPINVPPTPRALQTAVYDPTSNRMILFAGFDPTVTSDLWTLSNANGLEPVMPAWNKLTVSGGPIGRYAHTAVYDQTSNRMTVFGGFLANFSIGNDVWVLSNASGLGGAPAWTQLTVSGGPIARYSHTAVYHQATNRMTVFGGFASPARLNDVWVLSQQSADPGITVQIVINPGEDDHSPATIELEPGSEIAVAILSTQTFDAVAMVDWKSLTFGRTGNEASLMYCKVSDEDDSRVGIRDLVCYFSTGKTGFTQGDTLGILKGKTLSGAPFQGTAPIQIEHDQD